MDERLAAAAHDVFTAIRYTPRPLGRDFHAAAGDDVTIAGPRGAGKTTALLAHAVLACAAYPGLQAGVYGRTPRWVHDVLFPALRPLDLAALGATVHRADCSVRFPGGSRLELRYAANLHDAFRRAGTEHQLLCFDEDGLFDTVIPAEARAFLRSRLRSSRPGVPILGVRATAWDFTARVTAGWLSPAAA